MGAAQEPTFEGDYSFAQEQPFALDGGGELQPVNVRYALYGSLNAARDNAVLACHALSGSARVADWWPQMFAPDALFDPSRCCIIGTNVLGSCYGSTGPRTINLRTGRPYGAQFPLVTVADMVRAQASLLDYLGVEKLALVVGGSIGGMQALQWAVDYPERVARAVAVGASPLPALGLALNHLQRQAIRNDPAWRGGLYEEAAPPARGLALARAIAMCSYKSAQLFDERYARNPNRDGEDPHYALDARFDIAGYLDYQGSIFVPRFDANSYLILSKAMDTFDLTRAYDSEAAAFRRIRARVLLAGISSDWLFPPADVLALATRMKAAGVDSTYLELHSAHGHDAFLADAHALAALIKSWTKGM